MAWPPVTHQDVQDEVGRVATTMDTGRLSDTSLRAAIVPVWKPSVAVDAGVHRLSPDGTIIRRTTAGTTGAAWDATEQAEWTVTAGAGASSYTDEQVRDVIGTALVAGTGVTVTVDDVADTITIAATGGGSTDPEVVRDTMATTLVAGANVTITPDDAGDIITIAATSGGGAAQNVVVHGADAAIARPSIAGPVVWVGSVDPANSDDTQDVWLAVQDSGSTEPATLPDATASTKGVLRLTGDLGGTAASPTVSGLANKADKTLTQNTQTGTTYTLVLADANTVVESNNAAAVALTVPPNSTAAYPVGTTIGLRQYGAGQVTVTAGSGVTIRSRGSALKTAGQYAEATLTKRATDEWVLTGDLVTA